MEESWSSGATGAGLAEPTLLRTRSLPLLLDGASVGATGTVGEIVGAPVRRGCSRVHDARPLVTLGRHYYPEGGWGWGVALAAAVAQLLAHGLHQASAILAIEATRKFGQQFHYEAGWLGALSAGVALAISPVTVALCVRKSTRVTAVLGGLVTALGCLFTSFASQFHQLFFSYGTVVGVGVGMTRDCSTLMVAQYFKRRRELVEIFIVSGSGLGISFMSIFIKGAITAVGWRFGLQAVTGVVFLTFILGTFYRSASLYHPQRRAILHLKNQTKIKRKMKDRNKTDDRQPFFDFSTLRSKTVRILLMSTGISAFGINTPIFFLAYQAEEDGLGDTAVLLQTYLGVAWTVGCVAFGLLVLQDSSECRIARQYLCQAAVFVCGLATMALTLVHGSYRGYVMFAWIYGIFCGGYHYSLKMYTYERVRSRNFARTWGFVQCSQAFPIAIGVPLSGYMNVGCGGKAGYYFSSTCSLLGSLSLFCIDIHRRSLAHKNSSKKSKWHECRENGSALGAAEGSNPHRPHQRDVRSHVGGAAAAHTSQGGGRHRSDTGSDSLGSPPGAAPELTCISEEGGLDLDLDMPDNLLDDFDYIGDCITSCNKVENYLMLSEYENNLTAAPNFGERRNRRWSSIAPPELAELTDKHEHTQDNQLEHGNQHKHDLKPPNKPKWKKTSTGQAPNPTRLITVINEASL